MQKQNDFLTSFSNIEEFKRKMNKIFLDPPVLLFIRRKIYERESDRLLKKVRNPPDCKKENLFCLAIRDKRFIVNFHKPKIFQNFPLLADLKPFYFASQEYVDKKKQNLRLIRSKSSPPLGRASAPIPIDALLVQKKRQKLFGPQAIQKLAPHECPEFSSYQLSINRVEEQEKQSFFRLFSRRKTLIHSQTPKRSEIDPLDISIRTVQESTPFLDNPRASRLGVRQHPATSNKKGRIRNSDLDFDDFFDDNDLEVANEEVEKVSEILSMHWD